MMPGRLYEYLKDRYSAKPRSQLEAGVELGADPSTPSVRLASPRQKIQLLTPAEDRMITISPDTLGVHVVRTYRGWEEYRPLIQEALEAYDSIAKPVGVRRIGIRYINKITMREESVHLGKIFTTPPQFPDSLEIDNIAAFLLRLEADYTEDRGKLIQTLASVEAEEGSSAFILDLDVIREWPDEPLPLEDAMSQVDDLRDLERDAFESLVTEEAKGLFDAE
jgi:uncharacterized protein (TIGR04255 family)